jgi:hypothetical protein
MDGDEEKIIIVIFTRNQIENKKKSYRDEARSVISTVSMVISP